MRARRAAARPRSAAARASPKARPRADVTPFLALGPPKRHDPPMATRPLLLALTLAVISWSGCATTDSVKPRPLPTGVSFQGNWDSTWGKMVLAQEGGKVHGTFTGYREGAVTGELDGDVFRFIWDQR